ncbi:hypothetical protein LCGC14_3105050 [marine sediment metagenome]|uniref:Uncharacterized protein n=1 Tax=marine sediment metagenome TaxID=412755 RepID=A0A0F8YE64_9ZZZZ
MPVNERVVDALKRLAKEVGYMLEAPTKELVTSAETQAAYVEASKALKEIGEIIE